MLQNRTGIMGLQNKNNISKALKHHLRNQGGHFLKSALNRVLIPAQECRGKMLQNRTRIMDLQNKNNIFLAKQEKSEIRPQCKVLCFEVYFKGPSGTLYYMYIIHIY